MKKLFSLVLGAVCCALPALTLADVSLDFNTFDYWDVPGVTVAADGSSALMEEQLGMWFTWLYKDYLSVPGDAVSLQFDYVFYLGPDDQDELYIGFYDDPISYIPYAGYEDWITNPTPGSTVTDTYTMDLSLAPFRGGTAGLEFQFSSYPGPNDQDIYSWIEISNAKIVAGPGPGPVIPEASTLILFGSGGLSFLGLYRPFRRRRR